MEIGMIWLAIKQAGADIWEELLNLIVFNLITLAGTLLIFPWPFVVFGLYEMAYDIGQGKGVKITTFFSRAARVWKPAYVWGGINMAAIIVIAVNLNFYANITATWAGAAQIVMVGMAIFWIMLQLIVLPIYPRLEQPGFKLAVRNATVLVGRYPFPIFIMMVIVTAMVVLMIMMPLFAALGLFSMTAVLSSRMVGAMIKRELGKDGGDTAGEKDPGFNIDGNEK
jgi:hypothetical protein